MGHTVYALSSGDAFLSNPSVSYKFVAIVNVGREEGGRGRGCGTETEVCEQEWYKVSRCVAGYLSGT